LTRLLNIRINNAPDAHAVFVCASVAFLTTIVLVEPLSRLIWDVGGRMALTVSYVTKGELAQDPGVKHLDPAVKAALFSALENDGTYAVPHERAWLEEGQYPGGQVNPIIQILETTDNTNVTTDATLKAIIMHDRGGVGHELDVSGGKNDEFIAMGSGGDTLKLSDQGNDTVYGGKGNDSINASGSTGNDSLVGGAGKDTIWGGSGNDTLRGGAGKDELHSGSTHGGYNVLYGGAGADTLYGGAGADSLYGGSGKDSLVGGSGMHQLLQAGSGNTVLVDTVAASGGTDTLVGGAGNDTIMGQQGDWLRDTGPAGSQNQFWLSGTGTGNSTLQGGAGKDTFHIETTTGNDTITGGGGHDVVDLDKQSFAHLNDIQVNGGGSYTLTFADSQKITVSGISNIHFSDSVDLKLP
jgi:Ca2+-binding RTX toxin-like protein